MKAHLRLAVLAASLSLPSFAIAEPWTAQQTTNMVSSITNALPSGTTGKAPTQQALGQYNKFQGYQSTQQISQGLQNNVLNNLKQIPSQPHIPSQVNGYTNTLVNGNMPNLQGDLQNHVAGQARTMVNHRLPRGVSIDPVQLLQQK